LIRFFFSPLLFFSVLSQYPFCVWNTPPPFPLHITVLSRHACPLPPCFSLYTDHSLLCPSSQCSSDVNRLLVDISFSIRFPSPPIFSALALFLTPCRGALPVSSAVFLVFENCRPLNHISFAFFSIFLCSLLCDDRFFPHAGVFFPPRCGVKSPLAAIFLPWYSIPW